MFLLVPVIHDPLTDLWMIPVYALCGLLIFSTVAIILITAGSLVNHRFGWHRPPAVVPASRTLQPPVTEEKDIPAYRGR